MRCKIQCIYSYLTLAFLAFISGSCANRVVPQGGPVDEDPPVLQSTTPENMSVFFSSNKVILRFDEYVKLENQDQVFISPPLSETPRYKANGKEVIVELPDNLSPDITYTINFGNSIVDNNEGNAIEDFKYVFSTGNSVDSLTLSGSIFRAEDLEVQKNAIVVLYADTMPDSSVFRVMPTYYSRVNDNGSFTIDNIGAGAYRLLAIEDLNKNFLAEIPSERIAFIDSLVRIPGEEKMFMKSFKQQPEDIKALASKSVAPGVSVVSFNGPAKGIDYHLLNNKLIYSEYNQYADSLTLYHEIKEDSTGIVLDDGSVADTTWAYRKISTATAPEKLKLAGYTRSGNDSLYISFNLPFRQGTSGNISADTTLIMYRIEGNDEGIANGILIPRPDSSISLHIDAGSFVDIHGNPIDSMSFPVAVPEERQTGILELVVSPFISGDTYVVLSDASWNRIEKFYVEQVGSFEITGLTPGKYILSAFLDEDNDGEWTPGDFFRKRQPEEVLVNKDEVIIRANWTVQINWELDKINK